MNNIKGPVQTSAPKGHQKRRLLVVDDDDLVVASLRVAMPSNWSMAAASSASEVPVSGFNAALVDMHLSGNLKQTEGLDVIRKLREQDPHIEIIAMSGDFDRGLMEQGLKAGATRFLAKPIGTEEIHLTLEKIEALLLLRELATSRIEGVPLEREPRWVGTSAASQNVNRLIAGLRGEHGPILIEGESGTGKEVAAWLIHAQERNSVSEKGFAVRPFVQINLAAIPETVFESELFGHVKGAFTGADQNKMGLAEAAHGGDLFLDEIEALPLANQAKLLRFLESGEIRRVGGRDAIRVQARVIVATNRKLDEMVKAGEFREDLMWRVSGKRLTLPPLRERKEDIEPLVNYFFELEKPRRNKQVAPDAIEALKIHDWSGNVRELKRVCEQIALHAPLPLIRSEDVRVCLPHAVNGAVSTFANGELDLSMGLNELLARFEAHVVRESLRATADIDAAAQCLGISRSSMYKKMKDFNIERS